MSTLEQYPALRAKMAHDERVFSLARAEIKHKVDGALPRIAALLFAFPQVRRAFLFGSFVTDTYRPDSDVDIAVEANGWTYAELAAVEGEIAQATGLPLHLNFWADIFPEMLEREGLNLRAFA